jgi:rod shape-determining protein MreD
VATILAFPILILLAILQSSIFSRVNLLQGNADLVLLVIIAWSLQDRVKNAWIWGGVGGLLMGFLSGLPFPVVLVSYLIIVIGARVLTRRIWQVPILMMLVGTTVGTFFLLAVEYLTRSITATPLPLGKSLSLVILPSILLNLLFSIPVYTLIADLANVLYPAEKVT